MQNITAKQRRYYERYIGSYSICVQITYSRFSFPLNILHSWEAFRPFVALPDWILFLVPSHPRHPRRTSALTKSGSDRIGSRTGSDLGPDRISDRISDRKNSEKPVCFFEENRQPNTKLRKIRKPKWTAKPKNRKTEVFWHKNKKLILK